MKKFTALFLLIAMICSLSACQTDDTAYGVSEKVESTAESADSSTDNKEEFVESKNVAEIKSYLGKDIDRSLPANAVFYERPYTLNRPVNEDSTQNPILTDGQCADMKYGQSGFVGFDGSRKVEITIDAGEEMRDVADIYLSCLRIKEYDIDLPKNVTVEASNDGTNFTLLSTLYTPDDLSDAQKYTYYFAFPQAINAKFYRISLNTPTGKTLYVDEVMAFEYAENGTIDADFTKRLNVIYTINDFYNYDLNLGESQVKVSETDADYNETQNLAKLDGVEFQISHWDALATSHSNDGMDKIGMLTDGIHHGTNPERDYFKFHRGGGRHVIADLGEVMSVEGCNLSFYDKYTWGITTPPVYYISVSENGTDWVTVFAEDNPDYGKAEREKDERVCNFKQAVKARYVRLSFETVPANNISAFVYLGEFEVMGKKNPENAVTAVYDDSIIYGNYPNPEKFGISDILFTGIGDQVGVHCSEVHVLSQQTALEYLALLDENGKVTERLMDSFAFTSRHGVNGHPNRNEGYSYFLDEIFYDGLNINAVEFAQAKINADLGTNDKCKIWISVNCPVIGDTFNGKTITTAEDYIECLKWMADEAIKRFNEKNYNHVELAGFYWQNETMRPHPTHAPDPAHDMEAAKAFNDYVHSLGYLSLWLPYYDCEGLYFNRVLGFDITCLQPNLMWYPTEESRITSAAEITKLYGCGIEIEIEHSAQTEEWVKFYCDYTGTGVDYGYINSINAYYQGAVPGAYIDYMKSENPLEAKLWEETLLYITDKLDKNSNRPESPLDLSAFTDAEITVKNGEDVRCEIGKLDGYKYRITQSPLFGFLTVNEGGELIYKSVKGYKGEDNVKITVFDGISEFKTFTVKITVTE